MRVFCRHRQLTLYMDRHIYFVAEFEPPDNPYLDEVDLLPWQAASGPLVVILYAEFEHVITSAEWYLECVILPVRVQCIYLDHINLLLS